MRRYAVTCALIVLIAASLGTYYAYGAELRLPEYRLQTLEGDPAQAAKLTVLGSYVGGKGSYPIEVTTTGSKRAEPTYWKQWMRNNGPLHDQTYSGFNALYEEHSGFMRGKPDAYRYYSDQEALIYAEVSYTGSGNADQDGVIHWSIDALDLGSGKETRYTDEQTLPARFASVVDVQKTGSEMHVLTNVNQNDQDNEVIDKVFDIRTGEPVRIARLPFGEPSDKDHELQIRSIAEDNPAAANPRVLFMVTEQSKDAAGNTVSATDIMPTVFSERMYEYDYASGDLQELTLITGAETAKQVTSTTYTLKGNTFTTLQIAEEAVTIDRYDLSASLAHPRVTIKASQLGKGKINQAQSADGLIYLLLQTGSTFVNNSKPIVAVADAADGRILYKGTPAPVNANGRPDDQLDDAWFLNMQIMR